MHYGESDGFSVAGFIVGSACVLAVCAVAAYGAVSTKILRRFPRETTTEGNVISNISFVLPESIDIEVGSGKSSTVAVRSHGIFDPSDIVFVSTCPQVAAVEYTGSVSSYIGFRVVGLTPGRTEISAKSSDGLFSTQVITVTVRPSSTTRAAKTTKAPSTMTDISTGTDTHTPTDFTTKPDRTKPQKPVTVYTKPPKTTSPTKERTTETRTRTTRPPTETKTAEVPSTVKPSRGEESRHSTKPTMDADTTTAVHRVPSASAESSSARPRPTAPRAAYESD